LGQLKDQSLAKGVRANGQSSQILCQLTGNCDSLKGWW
jgi:hypothetical protein